MKRHLFIGFVFGLAMLVACNKPSDGSVAMRHGTSLPHASLPELAAIDSLMWLQPDSALAVLQHFAGSPQADSLDKLNGHYCQLLISELLYKNDYGQSNRPALQQAVTYFDSLVCQAPPLKGGWGDSKTTSNQNDNLVFLDARAHYINGVGYYEQNNLEEACAEYINALETMESHFGEKELVGHKARFMAYTYNRLGEMFSEQFMMEPAIECFQQSYGFCKIEPASPYSVSNALYRIGLQYDKMHKKDSANYYYECAIELIPDNNNLTYRDLESSRALLSYQLGQPAEASLNTLLRMVRLAIDEEEQLTRFFTIGSIYFEEAMYDSALRYLEPVFQHTNDVVMRVLTADYIRVVYDSIGDVEKSNMFMRFLTNQKTSDGENKALVSKLEDLYKNYSNQKKEKEAEKAREKSIRKTVGIIVPISMMIALTVFIVVKLRSKKLLKKHQEEAKRALEEAGRQHEQELIQQREEALAAERTHRIQQSALSNRLKRSNEELRELKDQIRQQTDSMNPKQEVQALSFNDEPICRLIMERVNEGQFKSKMDYTSYKDYALGKDDLVALREAANRHFNQFTIRLAKAYPALTQGDLDYCCLYLLGLSDADVSALMQRAYNTVNERNSKLRRVLGSENAISFTLQAIANESISI